MNLNTNSKKNDDVEFSSSLNNNNEDNQKFLHKNQISIIKTNT